MKIGILGDLHLRHTNPVNRSDDYYKTQFQKLKQAFDLFDEEKCSIIIQPGDLFNNYGRDPYSLLYDTMNFFTEYDIPVFSVPGQHDVKFHNIEVRDVPFQILVEAGYIHEISASGTHVGEKIFLYGFGWNVKLADPQYIGAETTNIAVMHKMVINGKKLWPGQTDYTQARKLTRKYEYDLFVCGDNHKSFVRDNVVNCGSIGRMNIDQIDHKPFFCVYNTETKEIEKHYYTLEETKDVFKEEESKLQKANDKRKNEFAEGLKSDFEGELDFRQNINSILKKKRRMNKRTKELIEEALLNE